ncbi:uncharacterized protein DUF4065 [Mesorhizobium sp. J18]|uniref:Panacea domain-containing protein n=1 Tax=Mesorhizobium sp. J18 TaxID=935263 RepID=UPI00119A3A57|nr:Panacea domain-containing protein [Mesorhizobium sp. J18]TWG90354.1 uncharacterized protein DUF4065 [Mesorhizobium sp. J18]
MGQNGKFLENSDRLRYMQPMTYIPRYIPNASKALEVILWIVHRKPGFDIYRIVKTAFFADKMHVASFGRPICGDTYAAAPWGPLPQVIYNLLRHDPIEMIALQSNGELPFRVDERHRVFGEREPNLRRLSESDVEALEFGVRHVEKMSFEEIYQETHADPAYINAGGSQMDYRDFIPDDDQAKAEKVEAIEETAPYAVF